MPGSRDVPDQRSPRDAILDVLASAKVKCPFAFEEIAESIMHALAIASADRQPDPAPTRIPVQSTKVIEKLQYSIDVYDERGNLVEVLGRLSRLDMARAAFDICSAQKPEQTITLRLKGQVIEESKPKGSPIMAQDSKRRPNDPE